MGCTCHWTCQQELTKVPTQLFPKLCSFRRGKKRRSWEAQSNTARNDPPTRSKVGTLRTRLLFFACLSRPLLPPTNSLYNRVWVPSICGLVVFQAGNILAGAVCIVISSVGDIWAYRIGSDEATAAALVFDPPFAIIFVFNDPKPSNFPLFLELQLLFGCGISNQPRPAVSEPTASMARPNVRVVSCRKERSE